MNTENITKMKRRRLSRGVITQTAKHFNITTQAVRHRMIISFDNDTINYALKLDAEIKAKKAKTKKKIKKYINITEPA